MSTADTFVSQGWAVVDLCDPGVVDDIGAQLLARLRTTAVPELDRLDDYHRYVDDHEHPAVHYDLASWYWRERLGHRIVDSELHSLRSFVGLDLHVQRYPYLRVARPDHPEDVTGLHRDLLYGASPFEVSMLVPFTDLDEDSALRVVSGSHVEPASSFPATRIESTTVLAGSPQH